MKIVVAVDSFKGSLGSLEIGECIKKNILQIDHDIEVVVKGIADGGEGTVAVLSHALNAELCQMKVHNAYGQAVDCSYAIDRKNQTAVIEVAEAVGLAKCSQRDPLKASTYGVGEVILACLNQEISNFIIGLGGSATNDAGIGMMEALGMKVTYTNGIFNPLEVEAIDLSNIDPRLENCHFLIASDVTNPLCGAHGATAIYGPQKGVSSELVPVLDQALDHFADLVSEALGMDLRNQPGAGAAGGLGFALMSFTHSKMQPGIELVMEKSHLEAEIKTADLVITGEGCIDGQSAMGKAPAGITALANQYQIPVIGIGGSIKEAAEAMHDLGMTAFFSIQMAPVSLEEALRKEVTERQLGLTIRELIRFMKRLL